MRGRSRNTLESILRNHVKILPNGCWEWKGATNGKYGIVEYHGKTYLAHRLLYILIKGAIPSKKELHHTCEFKKCVNPSHTEPHYHIFHASNFHKKRVIR